MENPILTLDTSGINRLADDPDSGALVAGLTVGFHVRLTFTSVSEIVQSRDRERRGRLLRLCRLLLGSGDCIDLQHELIRKMVVAFEGSPSFDWRTVLVEFPEAKIVLDRQENVSDEIAEQEREQARTLKQRNDAKPAFDNLLRMVRAHTASVGELVTRGQLNVYT
jgi:hypothetical protein